MQFKEAFGISRSLNHGMEALKRAPFPLIVGAAILAFTEGSGNTGGNNWGSLGDDEYDWQNGTDNGYDQFQYQLERILDRTLNSGLEPLAQAGGFGGMGGTDFDSPAILLAILAGGLCVGLIVLAVLLLRSWVHVGYIRLHREVIQTGEGSFGTLFGGGDRLGAMVGWKILSGLISFGCVMVALLPGGLVMGGAALAGLDEEVTLALMVIGGLLMVVIALPVALYVGLGLMLGHHALVLDELSVTGALSASWRLASGNRLTLLVYGIVLGLVALVAVIVGLLLCCIGLFATIPIARAITDTALTECFMLVRAEREEAEGWTLIQDHGWT